MGMLEVVSGGWPGTGPTFLNDLRCTISDTNLLECPSGVQHGRATCPHSQDVGVKCQGILR